MTADKIKRRILRPLAAVIPVVVILALLSFPRLLRVGSTLTPLTFSISGQSADGGGLALHGSFSNDIHPGETVWLYAENAEITVRAGDQSFRVNQRSGAPAMFRSPGSGWYSFSSPGMVSGEPVEITVRSYYNENERAADSLLSRLYLGDGAGLLSLLLGQIGFFSLILICAVIVGMIYLLEGAIDAALGMAEGTRIALFGLYFLTGGLWCVPDVIYPYLSLFITPPWAAALLDMLGLLLFPIALALMMRYYIRAARHRRVMNGILWAEIATAAVCLLVQMTGKADLVEQQLLIGSVALVSLGTAMVCVVLELWHYKDRYLLLLFLSVLPVFVCEMMDGVNLLWPFMPRRVLMRYGFGLSILLLGFQFVSFANVELAKAEKLRRAQRELVNSRVSVMLSQIQPHFLYNALQGIKALCDAGDPSRASDALGHFSYYLRGNLDALADGRLVCFDRELKHIEDYLYLEKMRFQQRLRIRMELSATDFLLPPLTVQPLIENAIRHGIMRKSDGGTLVIKTERSADGVVITVEDDGVGFDPGEEKMDERSHIGLENTRLRLETLCGGSLVIESREGMGTTAKIFLPQKEAPSGRFGAAGGARGGVLKL